MDKLLKEKRFVYLRLAKIERSRAVARALARVSMPWQQKNNKNLSLTGNQGSKKQKISKRATLAKARATKRATN